MVQPFQTARSMAADERFDQSPNKRLKTADGLSLGPPSVSSASAPSLAANGASHIQNSTYPVASHVANGPRDSHVQASSAMARSEALAGSSPAGPITPPGSTAATAVTATGAPPEFSGVNNAAIGSSWPQPSTPGGTVSLKYEPPCAACKALRRKCTRECVFLPYFPREEPEKFVRVHKVFGASNVAKMLQDLPPHHREDAMASLDYEAQARVQDPVYGCVGILCVLQRQVIALREQLAAMQAQVQAPGQAQVQPLQETQAHGPVEAQPETPQQVPGPAT
eukprot:TRINITY_DN33985_c0_g1_i1.p1 TRINITY_DN33985_c0_g1~~TRINITY_DN33985_c0_g1_i1.p1  ORF type:complete len:280 (-),score=5.08 TRINITY_DN33985_c0_g1_i1:771-1610(-)